MATNDKRLSIAITPEQYRILSMYAAQQEETRTEVIHNALAEYFNQEGVDWPEFVDNRRKVESDPS